MNTYRCHVNLETQIFNQDGSIYGATLETFPDNPSLFDPDLYPLVDPAADLYPASERFTVELFDTRTYQAHELTVYANSPSDAASLALTSFPADFITRVRTS